MNNKLRKLKRLYLNGMSKELKKSWDNVVVFGGLKTLNFDLFDDKTRRHVWITYSLNKDNELEVFEKSNNLSTEELNKIVEPIQNYISEYFDKYAKVANIVETYGEKGAQIYQKNRRK